MAIRLENDVLFVDCPDVHPVARMRLSFQRTLRVPDDGVLYDLPPSLGNFTVQRRDGTSTEFMLPMWQSEACWINFDGDYPFLVTIGSGATNVVSGRPWSPRPNFTAEDYLEVPTQPWLDGFTAEDGAVRQFVAAPLGRGLTVEEQVSTEPARGGIRLAAYPMTAEAYPAWAEAREPDMIVCYSLPPAQMGLGAGGRIRQSVAAPTIPPESWDLENGQYLTVDLVNSDAWQSITGRAPQSLPLSAAEYTRHGFPWFTWYDDKATARRGSSSFDTVTSVADGDPTMLPENESFTPPAPITVTA